MDLFCQQEARREAVRIRPGWNGLDYVEVVDASQKSLRVFFLGKLPTELQPSQNHDAPRGKHRAGQPPPPSAEVVPGLERYFRLEGGQRVTNLQVKSVARVVEPDSEKDDSVILQLDQPGDFSTYTLRLVGVQYVDPHYDHLEFSFKVDCPSDLDCAPVQVCPPPVLSEPETNYLAKDYASFRQLILDRLALLLPDWKERHVPDLGLTLVELLAYAGDHLSYYQDAVGTEAYLGTARRRISVRRHARLVDYKFHEGCNARAWVCVGVSSDLLLDPAEMSFMTRLDGQMTSLPAVASWQDLSGVPESAYQVFEPLLLQPGVPSLQVRSAHNEIPFYTWGHRQCCLPRGATSATLLDDWVEETSTTDSTTQASQQTKSTDKPPEGVRTTKPPARMLDLHPGDILIFEEVRCPQTGLPEDADPSRRCAVRLTRVTPGEDPVVRTQAGLPTPYVQVEWNVEDALPFAFCLSRLGNPPDCDYLENLSVARGNVVLVDHGRRVKPEPLGAVPALRTVALCECEGRPGERQTVPGSFQARLGKAPLTFRAPMPVEAPNRSRWVPAAALLTQDVRAAVPQVWLTSTPTEPWEARYDLLASEPEDRHFVVEIDDDGLAHLRFGDGELGRQPPAGMTFTVTYRVGNGLAGNVGAEAITRLVLANTTLSGISITVRNPLPARGGTDSEPIAEAKLLAPYTFRQRLERAIVAEDYALLSERNPKVQNASATLAWTGSWYEATVAIDPLGGTEVDAALRSEIGGYLHRFRRMGHDLRVVAARYVPLDLSLRACILPHFQRAHVKAALLAAFSNRLLPDGQRGFFHPDNLTFGEGLYLSRIVAVAQGVPGVESVTVVRFQRLFESANHEIENGVLPLGADEIARLDNDPNYPERGQLEIQVCGGR